MPGDTTANILVNSAAITYTSYGVKRYAKSISSKLPQDIAITKTTLTNRAVIDKVKEIFLPCPKDHIIWSPSHRGPLFCKNHVVTVHDCINTRYIHNSGWKHNLLISTNGKMLRNAARIVAISESTSQDLQDLYGIRSNSITVIRSSNEVIWPSSCTESSQIREYSDFILIVTNKLIHKNSLLALRAIQNSRAGKEKYRVVVVGDPGQMVEHYVRESSLRVDIIKSISDEELHKAYSSCAFYISPSLSEGHNLTIAEALSTGCTVICSDIPAHREFYDGQVAFFDPNSIDAMVDAIDGALDGRHRNSVSRQKLDRCVHDVANDYASLFYSMK